MTRYFFDIRDGDSIAPDEEGLEFPHVEAAQEEAAHSLADLVRDKIRDQPYCHMAMEVRDEAGPVLEAKFVWELQSKRQLGRLSWQECSVLTRQCGTGRV